LEVERKIATGRMAHLILENSLLLKGHDYSENLIVNELISNQKNQCVVLFPGENSVNLSKFSNEEKESYFKEDKNLVIFLVDGTWTTAKQTMRVSENLKDLPRISFDPSHLSNFRVRKQPKGECLSTIEAIHQTIELLGERKSFSLGNRPHDNLLHVFNYMVENQLLFMNRMARQI
jgi:DTW domain-containing protein YfiP